MAEGTVTERRLRPIRDAVDAGNWKQALKECEKWQKKGEKSDRFLTLKSYVLINQTDKSQIDKGEAEALQLCQRTPAITDLDAIHTLQDALRNLSLEAAESSRLWERAVAANPSDRVLTMTWLNDCVDRGRWQSAQKAAMALRKAFPNERQHDFWNILLCFLVHQDNSVTQKERNLFGTLAYRMMSKAAESIPTDQESVLTSGKAVATPEEVALLVQIYLATGHANEAVELLRGPTLNEKSRVGGHDPQLIHGLVLEALQESKQWDRTAEICKTLLAQPEHREDDRIWKLLLEVYSHADETNKQAADQLLIKYSTDEALRTRASLHARMKQLSMNKATDQDDILTACKTYTSMYGQKSFAFQDLRPSLEVLDEKHLRDFQISLQAPAEGSKSSRSTRVLTLKASRLERESSPSVLLGQATDALEVYGENATSPDPILLAALSMARLSIQTSSSICLLRALALLTLARTSHDSHFPIAVFLVSIYRHLGLFSLAISTFDSLSVKNLQWETVGHCILTRISTLHPHAAHISLDDEGKEQDLNPDGALDAALTINEKITKGLAESIKRGLREGSYSNILEAVTTRSDIERSTGKRVYATEERRLGRMTGDPIADTNLGPLADAHDLQQLREMRDFTFFPAYSTGDEDVWKSLSSGPLPCTEWIQIMTLSERLAAFFEEESKDAQTKAWDALVVHRAACPSASAELTDAELNFYKLTCQIIDLIKTSKSADSTSSSMDIITSIISTLRTFCDAPSACPTGALELGVDWHRLHTSYMAHDAVYLTTNFIIWAGKEGQARKGKKGATTGRPALRGETAEVLGAAADALDKKVEKEAKMRKAKLGESGVLGHVVDLVMGVDWVEMEGIDGDVKHKWDEAWKGFVEGHGGEVAVEVCVGKWLESWEDALAGVVV